MASAAAHDAADAAAEQLFTHDEAESRDSVVGDDDVLGEGRPLGPIDDDDIPNEINTETFNKLQMPQDLAEAAQQTWANFLALYPSKIAAGETIFTAIFDAAPSLQAMFKSPKATTAERFVKGFGEVIRNAGSKSRMMNSVQIMGFRHLEFDINVEKVEAFRDALLDLFDLEMTEFSAKGRYAMALLINYIGGALIFMRHDYQPRIELIHSTWQVAKLGVQEHFKKEKDEKVKREESHHSKREGRRRGSMKKHEKHEEKQADNTPVSNSAETQPSKFDNVEDVPTNFAEMFNFNVSAMGFGASEPWMSMVLDQLDDLVMNVANTTRMKEECEKLALFLSKHQGPVVLSEVRSVALSSLKSFVSAWDEEHETAWTWFWSNVERLLSDLDGKLQVQEQELEKFMQSSKRLEHVVQNVHLKFFEIAPAGQEFFKESKTRMYHIAERTLELTLSIHREPKETVDQLSSLGLRHVGMSIPVEFFPPFVQAAVEALLIAMFPRISGYSLAQKKASDSRYDEMLGFARLHRCDSVVAPVETISKKKWNTFQENLHLWERLEFNAGDVGIAGGLQVLEPAVNHPTASETIKRYGGTSSVEMPWPEERTGGDVDPFEELERDMLDIIRDSSRSSKRATRSHKSKTSTVISAALSQALSSVRESDPAEK